MGNTPVTVGLSIDEDCYSAGSRVTGKIFVCIKKKKRSSLTLKLRVLGQEDAVIHYTTKKDKDRIKHNYDNATSYFYNFDYTITSIAKGQCGQFEYPFSLTLPTNLPGSMKCSKGQSFCEIKYGITAIIEKGNEKKAEAVRPFSVLSIASSIPDSNLEFPQEKYPVNSLLCYRRGDILLEATANKAVLRPNDLLDVSFICRNRSTSKVRSVQITLTEVVEWRTRDRTEQMIQPIAVQDWDAARLPELAKMQRRFSSKKLFPEFVVPKAALDANIGRVAQIRVPSNPHESYSGGTISVRHTITVKCQTAGWHTSNAKISTRCQIVSANKGTAAANNTTAIPAVATTIPESQIDYQPPGKQPNQKSEAKTVATALPPDWNPQTAHMTEIPMAHATLVGPEAAPGSLS